MLQINNLSKQFSGHILFQDISLTVGTGEKIGLVGRNGSGKSTLFKIITGKLAADNGVVQIPKDYTLGYLEQFINFTQDKLIDECALSLKGEDQHNVYKAEKILSGLGFSEEDFLKDPKSFSGGMQLRINLCKCLLGDPSLLLLDEPTNYLDISGIRWLKTFLRKYNGEVLLITHDRFFMDDIVTHTVGLHRGKAYKVKGVSTKYYKYILDHDEVHENTRLNQEKKKKDIEQFVDKFRAKARQASMAQSRVKMLEKMEDIKVLPKIPLMSFKFSQSGFNTKEMGKIKNVSFGYNEKINLVEDLSFTINHKDRIAIMGANGKGKSTLLRLLSQELTPSKGEIRFHHNIAMGVFGQTNLERLHPQNTIFQEIKEAQPDLGDQKVRSICGAMLFSGDDALKAIRVLSGGEKSRVMLGKILANPCNLLLLDEPTNHFDQESIEILVNELKSFDGAIVFVTHSEYFAQALANKMIYFKKDRAQFYPSNYTDFLAKVGWDDDLPVPVEVKEPALSFKEIKKKRSEIIKERSKFLKPLKTRYQNLEDSIHGLELSLTSDQDELVTASEKGEGSKISELSKQIAIKEKAIEEMFTELEDVDLELKRQEDKYQEQLDQLNE